MTDFRFDMNDRVRVVLDRQVQDPEDKARDGREATIDGIVSQAQIDGYRVRFDDGYQTFVYEREAVALDVSPEVPSAVKKLLTAIRDTGEAEEGAFAWWPDEDELLRLWLEANAS